MNRVRAYLEWRKQRPHPSTARDFRLAYVLWRERNPLRKHRV